MKTPGPSLKPLMTGKLMEIFLLRAMIVNESHSEGPCPPSGEVYTQFDSLLFQLRTESQCRIQDLKKKRKFV